MKQRFVLQSKVTPPVLPGSYPRKRLFRRLDLARRKPVVWVSGPPGCGKTTLVSSYLTARGAPHLWYRLDERDNDIASFFLFLAMAAKRPLSRMRRPLPAFTHEVLPTLPAFTLRYFEDLCGRLASGSVLVFDDYQNAPADTGLPEVIRNGLSCLPEGINAIVISRSDPPPLFARKHAHGMMEVIGWNDLRLTPEETSGIARLQRKRRPGGEDIVSLQSRSDGWAAGLVLLLTEAGQGGTGPRTPQEPLTEEMFGYFSAEIFEGLGGDAKAFLLKSAFLPRMTAQMAERMTGRGGSGRFLSYLSEHNYFTEKRHAAEPVYEYHPLFRKFLLTRAENAYPPAKVSKLRKDAVRILEGCGYLEESAWLSRQLEDRDGLVRAIKGLGRSLVKEGRNQVLVDWIGSLPGSILGADPWLQYWMGAGILPFRPVESRHHFVEAFGMFQERGNLEGILLAGAGVVDSAVYGPESLKTLDPWFSTLDGLVKTDEAFPSAEIGCQVACTMVKALSLRRPPFIDTERWAQRAMKFAHSTPDVQVRFSCLLNVAYYRFHNGDLRTAAALLESLRGVFRGPEISPLSRLMFCWLEAAHMNMSGLYDRCRKAVSEGLEFSDATGVHLMDLLLLGHGALCTMQQGDVPEAKAFLRRMTFSLTAAKPWEASFYHLLAGWYALRQADRGEALFHSGQSLALSEEVGNPWTEALACLQGAVVHHDAGRVREADALLERAGRLGRERGMRFVDFISLLTGAFFSLGKGEEVNALSHLRQGLEIGQEEGYGGLYLWRPGMLETLCAKALEEGIQVPYVTQLIRKTGLVPDDAQRDLEAWPWPLKVFLFERFRLEKEGKELRSPGKIQQKPLMLLKALVASGGTDVPEERVIDLLWPEADGDLGHQSLATTLSRLRRLLGNDRVVRIREGRLTLDDRYCWVDAWAFERILENAESAAADGKRRPETVRLLTRAVDLYKGVFLPGERWPHVTRERLRSKFLRAVAELGGIHENDGDVSKAIACYQKGLETDPLAEGIHRRLIACHIRLGEHSEAVAAYRRCRETLSTVLGVAPSAETERLISGVRPSPRDTR